MAKLDLETKYEVVIEPSRGWFRFEWREFWEYRDLLTLLIRRDFLAKYKQTILGPLWFIVQPLLTTMMFAIVFGRIAQIPTDNIPAPLFYMCGLLIWNYFAQNVATGSTTFTTNAHLFTKVYFPRLIVPAASTFSNLITFALQLLPFAAFYIYYKFFTSVGGTVHLGWNVLWMPLLLAQVSLFSFGVSLILSSASAKYRDLAHLNQFLIQLWMFATPIIYPFSNIPLRLQWLAWVNPMAPLVEGFRIALLGRGTLPMGSLAMSVAITVVVLISGILVFQRMERSAVDNV